MTQVVFIQLCDVWQIETTREVNAKSIDEAVRFAKILQACSAAAVDSTLLLLGKKCAKFYGLGYHPSSRLAMAGTGCIGRGLG